MKNVLGAILLVTLVIVSSCHKDRVTGAGSIITEERPDKNFTQISMAGSTNVIVSRGSDFSVKVKGYSNLLPYFKTSVTNGTLELGYDEHVNVRHDNTEVFVTLPVLTGLSVAGSGDIISTGDFTGNNNFETNILGSGSITLERGSATNFSNSIMGSGDLHAFGFTAEKAKIEVSGSGDTKITATSKLNVQIAGSGDVYYKGSPNVTVHISGSGKVIRQ
jgi:hypothetical protein